MRLSRSGRPPLGGNTAALRHAWWRTASAMPNPGRRWGWRATRPGAAVRGGAAPVWSGCADRSARAGRTDGVAVRQPARSRRKRRRPHEALRRAAAGPSALVLRRGNVQRRKQRPRHRRSGRHRRPARRKGWHRRHWRVRPPRPHRWSRRQTWNGRKSRPSRSRPATENRAATNAEPRPRTEPLRIPRRDREPSRDRRERRRFPAPPQGR
jgi:hypothetical protein